MKSSRKYTNLLIFASDPSGAGAEASEFQEKNRDSIYIPKQTNSPSNTDTNIPPGNNTDKIRQPRLARRNLRDKGQLPRSRGPDKPSQTKTPSTQLSVVGREAELTAPLIVPDEFAPDAERSGISANHPDATTSKNPNHIPQMDGNASSSSDEADSTQNLLTFPLSGHNPTPARSETLTDTDTDSDLSHFVAFLDELYHYKARY